MTKMKIEPVIAALNDSQSLNNRQVLHILIDFHKARQDANFEFHSIIDYLHSESKDHNDKRAVMASKMIKVLSDVDIQWYQDYLTELEETGVYFLPAFDKRYPSNLWKLDNLPLALYIDGNIDSLENGIAVVGTRQAKEHRLEFVRKMSQELVNEGFTVVSGLAKGVDAAAHKGALEAGGETVAVLPGHIKNIQPSSNRELGRKASRKGA